MSKYTPGPWDADAIYTLLRSAWKSPERVMGNDIGDVVREGYNLPSHYYCDANLIAAAPDLLEAADAIANFMFTNAKLRGEITLPQEYIDLQAAITKAKGEVAR